MNFLDTKFKHKHEVGQIAGLCIVVFCLDFGFGGFHLFPCLISFFFLDFGLNQIEPYFLKNFHDLELIENLLKEPQFTGLE